MNDTKHPNCKQRECVGGVITTMHTAYPCPDCNVRVPRATYDALVALLIRWRDAGDDPTLWDETRAVLTALQGES